MARNERRLRNGSEGSQHCPDLVLWEMLLGDSPHHRGADSHQDLACCTFGSHSIPDRLRVMRL